MREKREMREEQGEEEGKRNGKHHSSLIGYSYNKQQGEKNKRREG